MPLWSGTTKPQYLTAAQKVNTFATGQGWEILDDEYAGNDNPNRAPEILVAIGELADTIGDAVITSVLITTTAPAIGSPVSVRITFSEAVDVTNLPYVRLTNGLEAGQADVDCIYASGTGTQTLVFTSINLQAVESATLDNAAIVDLGGAPNEVWIGIAGHGFVQDELVVIAATTNYNGTHRVLAATNSTGIAIESAYVAETPVGTETCDGGQASTDVLTLGANALTRVNLADISDTIGGANSTITHAGSATTRTVA